MTNINTRIRNIAQALTPQTINGKSPLHSALHETHVGRNADLIARLVADTGISVEDLERGLIARHTAQVAA